MQSLHEMFEETLKDVYFAENAIIKALPKMAKKAQSEELRSALEEHLEETKGQVERLEKIFEIIGSKAQGKKCHAIEGLVEETEELMQEAEAPEVRDAGLIGAAQAVEHYEIARYGTLKAWADQLELDDAAELLEETLAEERQADEKLTELAMSGVNEMANENGEDDEENEEEGDDEKKSRPKSKSKAAGSRSKR